MCVNNMRAPLHVGAYCACSKLPASSTPFVVDWRLFPGTFPTPSAAELGGDMAVRPAAILPFLKETRPYALYVLVVLMVVFTLNQKDRFLLGVTSGTVVRKLHFGDYSCSPNTSNVSSGSSGSCDSSCAELRTQKVCEERYCKWDHTPLGLKYELLAGPLFTFIFTLATIPVGLLASSRWVNRRVTLSFSLALWSAMTLATAFTHRYWQFLLARIGLGLFEAVCTPFASSIISDYFQEKFRGTALGFYNWGIYLGYSMAFSFNFVLNSHSLGWRWVFIIASLPGFAVALLMLVTVREPTRYTQEQSKVVPVHGKSLAKEVLRAYLNPALLTMCVAGGIRLGAGLVWAYNVKAYFDQLHCGRANVGHYLTWVPLVGGTLGSLLGGLLSDRLAGYSGYRGRLWVLILSQICAAPFVVGTLYLHSIPLAFVSLIPAYIVGETWLGICLTVAIELVPPAISPASISLFLFISNNISSVMPLLLPVLEKYYGLQRAMLILFPGLYVISATLFSVSLLLLVSRDLCWKHKDNDEVKSKSPNHARETSRERKRRRRAQAKLSEASPLLQEDKNASDKDSTDSYSSDYEETDEREQNEAGKAMICPPDSRGSRSVIVSVSVNDRNGDERGWSTRANRDTTGVVDTQVGASVSVMARPLRGVSAAEGRGPAGRARRDGYGAVSATPVATERHSHSRGPAPVVGSVSEWSVTSPSEEEKRWLAETQEGI